MRSISAHAQWPHARRSGCGGRIPDHDASHNYKESCHSKSRVTATLVALVVLAFTSTASASTLSMDGGTLVLTAPPGETNGVALDIAEDLDGSPPRFSVRDTAGITAAPETCEAAEFDPDTYYCRLPASFRAALGDGNDTFNEWDPFHFPIDVDAGAGNDRVAGYENIFVSHPQDAGSSTLRGGAGEDEVFGNAGDDRVLGEAGNDLVSGDKHQAQGTDVIDGGPGLDRIVADWAENDVIPLVAVDVSIDGVANDGRPGEGDNVVAVEAITHKASGSYSGGAAAENFDVALDGAATVNGGGGADQILTYRGSDAIDGGDGADDIKAGYGADEITGGAGPDVIDADGCLIAHCDIQSGDDLVFVRDGEVDRVTCGPGDDAVAADANDVVASDCETIERLGPKPPIVDPPICCKPRVVHHPQPCVVPKLKGKTVRKAKRALKKANCKLGRVKRARSRRKIASIPLAPSGRVIRQSPSAGKRLPAGTKVHLTLARR